MSGLSTFRVDPRSGVGIAAQIRTRIAFLIADGELAMFTKRLDLDDLLRQRET